MTVGVLSDSVNCYTYYETHGTQASGPDGYAENGFEIDLVKDMASGDLPSSVNVLEDADCTDYDTTAELPFSDEGRAMLQIVHDVAPGASLAFPHRRRQRSRLRQRHRCAGQRRRQGHRRRRRLPRRTRFPGRPDRAGGQPGPGQGRDLLFLGGQRRPQFLRKRQAVLSGGDGQRHRQRRRVPC